ncbi:hypothetical protein J6590_039884 [Homalodisca vitripennis]|nr:hypothetical protein J6590_039884 [Homalodisca vitripennis]
MSDQMSPVFLLLTRFVDTILMQTFFLICGVHAYAEPRYAAVSSRTESGRPLLVIGYLWPLRVPPRDNSSSRHEILQWGIFSYFPPKVRN